MGSIQDPKRTRKEQLTQSHVVIFISLVEEEEEEEEECHSSDEKTAAGVELLNGSQISKQSDLWLTLQEVISFNFQAAWASAAAHFSDN